MYRENVDFWSPHTKATRLSKSFTAFKLKQGMNYAQFLNLPSIPSTQRGTAIPSDFNETVTIQLPEMQHTQITQPPPIQKVVVAAEDNNQDSAAQQTLPTITFTPGSAHELGGVHPSERLRWQTTHYRPRDWYLAKCTCRARD